MGLRPPGRAPGRTTRCSRGPGRRSSRTRSAGCGSSASSCRPVIGGDYEARALPVGVRRVAAREPDRRAADRRADALVGQPARRRARAIRCPPGRARPPSATPRRPGSRSRTAAWDRRGCAGRSRSRAEAADGVALTTRTAFEARFDRDLWADFAADGRLDPEPVGSSRPALAGEQLGGAVAATLELAPGESRTLRFAIAWDLPVAEFGGGRQWWKRYTRGWGRSGARAWDLAAPRARGDARLAGGDRGVAGAGPRRTSGCPPGTARRCSTSCTSSSTAARSGRRARSVAPSRRPTTPGGSPSSSASTTGSTTRSTSTSTPPSRSSSCCRSWSGAGSATCSRRSRAATRRPSRSRRPGVAGVRKDPWTVPHDVGGPDEDPFVRPNRYRYQDVNGWIDLGPKLALQAWRDVVHLRRALVAEARPVVEASLRVLASRDRDGDGLPDHAGLPDQTYDTWPMHGPSAYGGLLWLGALAGRGGAGARRRRRAGGRRVARGVRARAGLVRGRLWRDGYYAYDDGGAISSDSVMADQLAGQWYADLAGLGDLVDPARIREALCTVHARNVVDFGDGLLGAVNGMRRDRTVDTSSEQSQEVWVGTTYALAALMLGRGLEAEALGDGGRRREGHLRARAVVPDARGVRPRRQLPGEPVPPAARDLGDRGGAPARRARLTVGRRRVSGAAGTPARRSRSWRRCWRPGRAGRTWARRRTAGSPRPRRRGTCSPGARRAGRAA